MSAVLSVTRCHDSIANLKTSELPEHANLYSLAPFKKGSKDHEQSIQCDVYPVPAEPAEILAKRLQRWIQDEVTYHADPDARGEPDKFGVFPVIPTIEITARDIEQAAEGKPMESPEAQQAYVTHCREQCGLRIERPGALYGWTTDAPGSITEFFHINTLREKEFKETAVNLLAEDIELAADGQPCKTTIGQLFLENQASTMHRRLIATPNYFSQRKLEEEKGARKDNSGYYQWVNVNGDKTVPWEHPLNGIEFAKQLTLCCTISPQIQYGPPPDPLLYYHEPPPWPDQYLVQRLASGEWPIDKWWGCRITKVPMFKWVIQPNPPAESINIHEVELKVLPSTEQRLTAREMAADLTDMLLVPVEIDDIWAKIQEKPMNHDAERAFNKISQHIAKANGIIDIVQI